METGQRREARQHYIALKDLLQKELGALPSDEIRSLEPRIFQDAAAVHFRARTAWPIRPSVQSPFIGQEAVLQRLRRAHQTGDGVLILGEAGAGKTRLVQEFYQHLEAPPRLLLAACHPIEENLPFHPWIDMLRNSVTQDEWQQLPAVWVAPLTMLLPELKTWRSDLASELESNTGYARTAVFEAISNLLAMLARNQRLLLFVDDAHWADEATLAVLAYLLEHSFFNPQNGMLVMASRLEEMNAHLDRLVLTSFPRRLGQVEMARLNEEETSALAFHILGHQLSEAFIKRLVSSTGGNPFFLLEMLQAILAMPDKTGIGTRADLPIPASMVRLIQGRLQKVSPAAHEVLLHAAVQGSRFEIPILEKAVSLSQEDVVQAIDSLEKACLIRSTGQDGGFEYSFIHEKIRDVLLFDLSQARSRLLHNKTVKALEGRLGEHTDTQAAVLAYHHEKAGNFSRAFDYWVQAGNHAYRLYSVEDATAAYKRAERLIARITLRDEQIYALYAKWSTMAFDNDDAETLERLNRTFLEIGQERGSDLLVGTALDGLSDACMAANKFDEGLKYAEQALPYLQRSGDLSGQINAHTHRGVFFYMLGRFPDAQECFHTALGLVPETNEPAFLRVRGHANYQMAITCTLMGWPSKGLEYARRCLEDTTRSRWPYGPVTAYSVMGLAYHLLADYKAGLQASLQGIELAKRIDGWRMLGYLHVFAGMNATELAALGSAWGHAQKALEIGQKYGHHEIMSLAYKVIGDIYTRLTAFSRAAEAYQRGVSIGGENFVSLESLHRLGLTLALMGDSRGETQLEQAIEISRSAGLGAFWAYARALRLSLFVERGKYEIFEREAEVVRTLLKERSLPDTMAWVDYLQAKVDFLRDDLESALSGVEALYPVFAKTPMFWLEMRTLTLHARILQRLDRDAGDVVARLQPMLEKIESSLTNAPLHDAWQAFDNDIRSIFTEY